MVMFSDSLISKRINYLIETINLLGHANSITDPSLIKKSYYCAIPQLMLYISQNILKLRQGDVNVICTYIVRAWPLLFAI